MSTEQKVTPLELFFDFAITHLAGRNVHARLVALIAYERISRAAARDLVRHPQEVHA